MTLDPFDLGPMEQLDRDLDAACYRPQPDRSLHVIGYALATIVGGLLGIAIAVGVNLLVAS